MLNGQKRGWQVQGIEPSTEAAEHSRRLGLDVGSFFFSEKTALNVGLFDAINLSQVLEHVPAPTALLKLVHSRLNQNGIICIVVPNDFNPFQLILRDQLNFKPWWIAPPHHINYFDFSSVSKLVEGCGFEVIHQEVTFPIDMFLLMGDNYIDHDNIGRQCHLRRKNFEQALTNAGKAQLMRKIYEAFAKLGIGREIVLFAKKRE